GVTSPVGATAAEVASSPAIASRVLKATNITDRTTGQLLSESSFSSSDTSNLLGISVTDRDPALAVTLANAYTQQYVKYSHELDTTFIRSTRREIEARLRALRAAGDDHSSIYTALEQKDQDLLEIEALQTVSAV